MHTLQNMYSLKIMHETRKEREKYGRFWLWENYSNPLNEPKWLENAEKLKHVNDHVIQDIEDSKVKAYSCIKNYICVFSLLYSFEIF